jgi:hypothetical protein
MILNWEEVLPAVEIGICFPCKGCIAVMCEG